MSIWARSTARDLLGDEFWNIGPCRPSAGITQIRFKGRWRTATLSARRSSELPWSSVGRSRLPPDVTPADSRDLSLRFRSGGLCHQLWFLLLLSLAALVDFGPDLRGGLS